MPIEQAADLPEIEPVYPLTAGLSPKTLRRAITEAVARSAQLGEAVELPPLHTCGFGRPDRGCAACVLVFREWMAEAAHVSPEYPVLIDKFLEDAIEIDVDAVSDGEHVVVGGVMEHIEKAGVHSGDAACALPPYSLGEDQVRALRAQTRALARALGVVGLLNVQFAVRNDVLYVLEVNPRASRTVPFVSKAIGVPLAKAATRGMLGHSLAGIAYVEDRELAHIAVKEAVFPFIKFPGVDVVLGPEMKSTGEVMGIDRDFRKAYLKSQLAGGSALPAHGKVFVSVKNRDKRVVMSLARRLVEMGFSLVATASFAAFMSTLPALISATRSAGRASASTFRPRLKAIFGLRPGPTPPSFCPTRWRKSGLPSRRARLLASRTARWPLRSITCRGSWIPSPGRRFRRWRKWAYARQASGRAGGMNFRQSRPTPTCGESRGFWETTVLKRS